MNRTPGHPEDDTYRNEIYNHILTALKTLNRNEREAFLLYEIEGLTYEEVADCMEISKSTVGRYLRRARTKLRKALDHMREL